MEDTYKPGCTGCKDNNCCFIFLTCIPNDYEHYKTNNKDGI